ncbi:unnamed protein product [Durusdinium trenchii]|uniref:PARP catalytic domain-containing protein n=1 Tax=Durusdinium trenchii TaxID=1381693 RepID=A0ABP0RZ76_9DINO
MMPEGQCPVCLQKHDGDGPWWRCSPCGSELCRFRFEETCSLTGVLQDPHVVSLHLSLASVAAEACLLEPFPQSGDGRDGCGKLGTVRSASAQSATVRSGGFLGWLFEEPSGEVITKAAPCAQCSTMSALLAKFPAAEELCQAKDLELHQMLEQRGPNSSSVLRLLMASCPLVLQSLERPEQQLGLITGPRVLELAVLQAAPAQEAVFRCRRKQFGSSFGLHGSPLRNWYSIMRNGLRILSHTELMGSGARFGPGVYLADRVSTAQHYCAGFAGSRYKNKLGEALQILAVVEYIKDPAAHQAHSEGITTVSDASAVMLRYLLVYGLSSHIVVDKLDEAEVKRRWTRLLDLKAPSALMLVRCWTTTCLACFGSLRFGSSNINQNHK